MNKLKTFKYKPSNVSTPNTENKSILSKLTKRYSNVVNSKLMRKSTSPSGSRERSLSPTITSQSQVKPKVHSGSYDMNGKFSEDYRPEIGAPILISRTIINDEFVDSTLTPTPTNTSSSTNSDLFVDAISSFPPNVQNIKFEFLPSNKENSSETQTSNSYDSSYYEIPKIKHSEIKPIKYKDFSKSAQNLHKSELKVVLQKIPSDLELDLKYTTADLDNCYDLKPIKENSNKLKQNNESEESDTPPPLPTSPPPQLFTKSSMSPEILKTDMSPPPVPPPLSIFQDDDEVDVYVSNKAFKQTPEQQKTLKSKSEPNTPMNPNEKTKDFLNHHYKSVDSLNKNCNLHNNIVYSSNANVNYFDSLNSQSSSLLYNSSIEDFDLKSVSCQSLNAKNIFLSIEELNEITKQINESEEFNQEIDFEYCEHRDNLKPSERRITLLKNKNTKLINLDRNKEKLNHAWSGLKNWIGEEKGKFKEVMQKQAAKQKVGSFKEDVNRSQSFKSNSQSRGASLEKSDISYTSSMLTIPKSVSGHTITEDLKNKDPDYNVSTFTLSKSANREVSPYSKKSINKEVLQGQNGFEELRRYIKQGGDFGKDLVSILQERIESEQLYAKSLTKMAIKLNKACRDIPGTIAEAWRGVANEMETRSEVHRTLSTSLTEEIIKPLKVLLENQHKTRKTVEANVDKAARILTEWRASESKAKKNSHTAARENEKLQDAMLDVRIQKSPSVALIQHSNSGNKNAAEKEIKSAEKDCAKLDNKRKKAEEAVKRADVEYYTLCIRAERARVDWEMSVLRSSLVLQNLENQRLQLMNNFVANYARLTSDINPLLEGICQSLAPQIETCNVEKDLAVVKNIRRSSEGPIEQLLPDFYCEHTTLAMNRERRKHALVKLLQLVKTDLERERRSRNGLKGLSQTLSNQDSQNVTDKLYHIRSMLTYLEGSRFKLQSALLELDHKPRTSHPLAPHIQITRDRTGLQQSILKVPLWLKNNDKISNDDSLNQNEDDHDVVNGYNIENGIRNDALIKHFDKSKNFNRSKSNADLIYNGQSLIDSKSNTLPNGNGINDSPTFGNDRGQADGGSNQHDSDFDEFSSQEDDDESQHTRKSLDKLDGILNLKQQSACNGDFQSSNKIVLSRCKALYSYTPKLYDELELNPGDVIDVHAKQEDGWWLGQLGEQIGIFPATYVEEFETFS